MSTDPSSDSLLERALSHAVDGTASDLANVRILDAAYDLFCRRGIQRTTMDDVARASGLSRITVYRRVDSKEALVEQVVLREFRRYFDRFLLDISRAATVEERVVVGFASSLRAIRDNPLIHDLLTSEPQLVVPSVIGDDGRTLALVSDFVAGQLKLEQQAGHVPSHVDVQLVAELMVRMSTSFLLTPTHRLDLDDDETLRRVALTGLVPMLGLGLRRAE